MSKITNSARGENCTLRLSVCNGKPETTVFAHVSVGFNSGMGTKPNDIHGVYACSNCHDVLDRRRKRPEDFSTEDVLRALIETQLKLVDKGLI